MTGEPAERGRPPIGRGPRFDLRFEAGRGLLRLARPLEVEAVLVDELELSLGRVAFPIDVSEGASRFRSRKTRVRRARFSVRLASLERAAAARGVQLSVSDPIAGDPASRTLSLVDAFGVVAIDVVVLADGGDLVAAVREVRSVTEGPATPWSRVREAARALGLTLDSGTGLLRLARPARGVLARALVPHGFRLPDERGTDIAPPRERDGRVVLELGPHLAADDAALERERFDVREGARLGAEVTARLFDDDLDGAASAAAALAARARESDLERATAERLRLAVFAEIPGREAEARELAARRDDAFGASVEARIALRTSDLALASRAVERMVRLEASGELAAEAVVATSRRLSAGDVRAALDLVTRVAARRPHDVALALERVELARIAGDPEVIVLAGHKALSAPLSASHRAEVAVAAARALARLDRPDEAENLYREALFASPDDPAALDGLAGLAAARGDRARAVTYLDRAARALAVSGASLSAAAAERRAAELLAGMGRLAGAESRLARAVDRAPDDPSLVCALARARARAGDASGASSAYERLLPMSAAPAEALSHALVEAACFELDDCDLVPSARPFVERLARLAPGDARLAPLERRVAVGPSELGFAVTPAPTRSPGSVPVPVPASAPDAEPEPVPVPARARPQRRDVDVLAHTELVRLDSLSGAPRNAASDDAAALARTGAATHDAAMLRRALDLAERAGDPVLVREVIELALAVIGDGPGRDALVARRARLDRGEGP